MKKGKQFLLGALTSVVVMGAFNQNTVISTSKYVLSKFNYNFDGTNTGKKDTITYNGELYVPAKFVTQKMGQPYSYNNTKKEIYIGRSAKTGAMSSIYSKPYSDTFVDVYTISKNNSVIVANEEYTSGYRFYKGLNDKTDSASFNLSGKYHTITGKLGFTDDSTKNALSIKILGDGKVLKEFNLEKDSLPEDLSIDVNGIKKFTIEMKYVDSTWSAYVGFVNVMVK